MKQFPICFDTVTDRARKSFWNKVDKNGLMVRPDLGRCWTWKACTSESGYPLMGMRCKLLKAHRVSFVLHKGPITPEKPYVLHHCDNKICCNPDHLFDGTILDNIRDMIGKGGQKIPRGIERPNSKLNDDIARTIRKLRLAGGTYIGIGQLLGFNKSLVRSVCDNRSWRHAV